MEIFAAAAISLSISLSLLIKKKKSPLYLSFSLLCLIIFFQKIGEFLYGIFSTDYWRIVQYCGILLNPPLLITFSRFLLHKQTFLKKRYVTLTSFISLILAVGLFTPLYEWPHFYMVLLLYCGLTLAFCYTALVAYIKGKIYGVERKRAIYVAIACVVAVIFSLSDVFHLYGYSFPLLSDIAMAALLYFILLVITHSELPQLYEIMARVLITFSIVVCVTISFYLVFGLFGDKFTSVFLVAFIIVLFFDPLKHILKKLVGYLFFEDTDINLLDEELEREKSVFLEEMATGLAHEIRNPLGSIKSAAQYLKSETDVSSESLQLFDVIIEETNRLNGVVSRFLNYAKPYSINAEAQNINRIVEKVIALIQTANISENLVIEKNLSENLPPVKVDGEQMMQVLLNMANNGIEAMTEGGILRFATSRIRDDTERSVEIAITDTGEEIKKEHLKNIFKPFFTTKKKGTGLGLAICQRIVKNHGGHIEVETSPEKGTTFHIRI